MGDDDLLLHDIASQHQLELEDREFMDQARLLTAVLIVGSNEDHAWSVENRRPRRHPITFNRNGSIFAYTISYDWSKGRSGMTPGHPNKIMLHVCEEEEVKKRPPKR